MRLFATPHWPPRISIRYRAVILPHPRLRVSRTRCEVRQQSIGLLLDYRIAFAAESLEFGPVYYGDLPAAYSITPCVCRFPAASVTPSRRTPSMLAISSCVMASLIDWQSVERQQQPAAQLLLY